MLAGLVVLCSGATPALAHDASAGTSPPSFVHVALRAGILLGTAVVAGAGVLRLAAPPPTAAGRRVLMLAAVIASVGDLVALTAYGAQPLLSVAQAVTTLACVQLMARPAAAAALGAAVIGLLAWEAGAGHGGLGLAAAVIHTAAASVWCAAAMGVATGGRGWRLALRRSAWPAVLSAALVAGTGIVQARLDSLPLSASIDDSTFGRLILIKATVLLVAVALAVSTRGRGRLLGLRVESVLLSVALLLGASLAALPLPPVPAATGRPVLRTVLLGATPVSVLVTPQRPGWNVVRTSSPVEVGTARGRLTPTASKAGASGSWARVWLPPGAGTLWVRSFSRLARLPLDTGHQAAAPAFATPDAPECGEATLALLVRRGDAAMTSCPSDGLSAADAAALGDLVSFLAGRGAHRLQLVSDSSPRSEAAVALVESTARRLHLSTSGPRPDAEILLSGWSTASGSLDALRGRRIPLHGVYLAPWLLSAPLLTRSSSITTLLALPFDPGGVGPLGYAARLARLAPGATPTGSGWTAYAGASSSPHVRLYASALVSVLPASLGHPHEGAAGWIPGGALTPVTGQLASSDGPRSSGI